MFGAVVSATVSHHHRGIAIGPLQCEYSHIVKTTQRRFSFVDDCLLATYTLAAASTVILVFAKGFSWPAELALLIVPTVMLSTYRRYRAAAICAGVAAIAGAWEIVPPSGSFDMDAYGVFAVVMFASVAIIAIGIAALVARRHVVRTVAGSNA